MRDVGIETNPNFSAYTSHSMNLRSARFTRKLTLTRSFSARVERARSVSPSSRIVLVTAVRPANPVQSPPLIVSEGMCAYPFIRYSLLQGESFVVHATHAEDARP